MSQATLSPGKRPRARRRNGTMGFLLFVLPAILFFAVFKYWPIVYSTFLSFTKWNFVSDMQWVGLSNYASMFTKPVFTKGLMNTFLYILALLPFFVALPLGLSVLLMRVKSKLASNTYKALFFVPTILAFSIICIVWLWMFNPSFGLLNNLLGLFGLPGCAWLSDKNTAFFSIVLVCGWKYIGSHMILYMAGLMNISQDCIEAATIDGANGWQCFWKIKFPLLAPTTVYLLTTSVIFAAERAFTAINLLTAGGPSYTTTNLSYVIYEYGFKHYNIGMASSIAVFTSILFLAITLVMMRTMGGFGYHDD